MREMHDERNRLLAPAKPSVARVVDCSISGPACELDLRMFVPTDTTAPLPAFIWFHGGGWVLSNIDACDTLCRIMANESGCLVIAVNYRLAPEHRFPAAVDDCLATVRWVFAHASELGVDRARIAVGGDSSGGNLAAVVGQLCQAPPEPQLVQQVLVYPLTDIAGSFPSMDEYADGYLLTRGALQWFYGQYLNDEREQTDPRASPLRAADVSRVAPALIVTAECDPVRDEGKAYADKLRAAGVPTKYVCYPGMVHPFLSFGKVLDDAHAALELIAATLRTVAQR